VPISPTYRRLPFDKALSWLKQQVPVPSERWDDFIDSSRDWAFTVSGITKAQALQSVFELTQQAIAEGTLLEDFKASFNEALERSGYSPMKPHRVRLVLLQNLRTSYGAGRYQQMSDPETMRRTPYWQWVHDDPITPRPSHKALDGMVFRADDPMWQTGFPPSGFGCRCKVVRLSDRQLRKEGLSLSDPLPSSTIVDKRTGTRTTVPAVVVGGKLTPVVDPGFAFAPGASTLEQRSRILADALQRLDPRLRQQVQERLSRGPNSNRG
jgi:SPP1 gp7 family putative phage head morphogenesis protein